MGFNTDHNIGIRRDSDYGMRNFENVVSTVGYLCGREGLEFLGTTYVVGDRLPFDVGGTSYSSTAMALLELYWNQGWITPTV